MMKKVSLFLTLVLSVSSAFAQKGKVTSATTLLSSGQVMKAKEAINQAIANEKTSAWPETYIVAAKVYTELGKKGQDANGAIKAYNFYKKAIALDEKGDAKGKRIGKYKKEIGQSLLFFSNELTNNGIKAFNAKDYKKAVAAFEGLLEVNAHPYMVDMQGVKVDTAIIYNTALAAYNGKMWGEAEKYFNESIKYKYGKGDAFMLLHQVYSNTGDSIKMGPNLKKGFETYPNDDRILTTLINYYLGSHQNDKAFAYLNKAIENNKDNPSFYYARAVLHDSNKDFDAALADYNECLKINANYFNAVYNIGVMYYNKAVEKMNLANDEKDAKKFETKKNAANAIFKKALPYFEKSTEIKPKETSVLESLKALYYRFGMNDKYKETSDKLKALKK